MSDMQLGGPSNNQPKREPEEQPTTPGFGELRLELHYESLDQALNRKCLETFGKAWPLTHQQASESFPDVPVEEFMPQLRRNVGHVVVPSYFLRENLTGKDINEIILRREAAMAQKKGLVCDLPGHPLKS
jgi:hypothetical protein